MLAILFLFCSLSTNVWQIKISNRLHVKYVLCNLSLRGESAWLMAAVELANVGERCYDVGGSRAWEHLLQVGRQCHQGRRSWSSNRRTTGWFGSTRWQRQRTVQTGRRRRRCRSPYRQASPCRTDLKRCYEVRDLSTIPAGCIHNHSCDHYHHQHHYGQVGYNQKSSEDNKTNKK